MHTYGQFAHELQAGLTLTRLSLVFGTFPLQRLHQLFAEQDLAEQCVLLSLCPVFDEFFSLGDRRSATAQGQLWVWTGLLRGMVSTPSGRISCGIRMLCLCT